MSTQVKAREVTFVAMLGGVLVHFCLDTSNNVLKSLDYTNFFLCEFPLEGQ